MGSLSGRNIGSKAWICHSHLKNTKENNLEEFLSVEELQGGKGRGSSYVHMCDSSKVDTEEEGQENNGTQREGLHSPLTWALHRCLLNPSCLVFCEAVQYLKNIPEDFVVENKIA